MDAMAADGTLTVRTQICNAEAVVIVQDDGSGMSAEVRERAFEPFFTTKGAAGCGLCLAEVYGIARRHRGSVTIVSAPGEGASVALHFPLERSALPQSESESTPPNSVPLHILVVEDHEDGREFLRVALLAKPTPPTTLDATLRMAVTRARELLEAKREAAEAKEQLEARKLIERAKGILMRRTGSSEPEAYRIMQRSSQDRSVRMVDIAKAVMDSEPGAKA